MMSMSNPETSTQQRLLRHAKTVFSRRGYIETRVSDITNSAGVSHGTFYTYFASKEDIFRAVVFRVRDEVLAAQEVADADSLSPRSVVERTINQYLDVFERSGIIITMVDGVATLNHEVRKIQLDIYRHIRGRVAHFIRELQQRGLVSTAVDPTYAGHALGGMVERFAYVWFVVGESFERDVAVEQLTQLWMNALAVDGGSGPR